MLCYVLLYYRDYIVHWTLLEKMWGNCKCISVYYLPGYQVAIEALDWQSSDLIYSASLLQLAYKSEKLPPF